MQQRDIEASVKRHGAAAPVRVLSEVDLRQVSGGADDGGGRSGRKATKKATKQ